jgi:hypothetical protein
VTRLLGGRVSMSIPSRLRSRFGEALTMMEHLADPNTCELFEISDDGTERVAVIGVAPPSNRERRSPMVPFPSDSALRPRSNRRSDVKSWVTLAIAQRGGCPPPIIDDQGKTSL